MNSKTIEIPDGYILVETTDDNGEIIYRLKKDDYTKIRTFDDVIRILGENDKLVKTHSLLCQSETESVAYSVIVRLRAEMIVKAFRNGLTFKDFNPKEIYSPLYIVDVQRLCITNNCHSTLSCPESLCINNKEKCEYMIEQFCDYFIEYFETI